VFCLDRERDSLAALPICALEILLVLNDAESYHWSPSLRVGAVIHANARCHRYRPHYR
jgi:hypothetical protein